MTWYNCLDADGTNEVMFRISGQQAAGTRGGGMNEAATSGRGTDFSWLGGLGSRASSRRRTQANSSPEEGRMNGECSLSAAFRPYVWPDSPSRPQMVHHCSAIGRARRRRRTVKGPAGAAAGAAA